jgi:hypothetical protein
MDYTVTIDPSFTADQLEAVFAGIDEWHTTIPDLHFTTMVAPCGSPSSCHVCVHPAYDPPDPSHDVIGSTYPGSDDDSTIWIYVDRIEATGWDVASLTQQTTAHEIGHALGLQHSGAGTLMAADVPDQAHAVTAADVNQFWSVRGRN